MDPMKETRTDPNSTSDEALEGDTSDVVEGPVGSARLRDPDEAADSAADLDVLPAIELGPPGVNEPRP
jgi:hypothetical protein